MKGEYLFDIDVISGLASRKAVKIAKVKIGIAHLFADSVSTWMRKQNRRVTDYLYFSKKRVRNFPWGRVSKWRLAGFILYCLLVFPLLVQAAIGYARRPDRAWAFHPAGCWLTLLIYASAYIKGRLFGIEPADRKGWSQ